MSLKSYLTCFLLVISKFTSFKESDGDKLTVYSP